MCVAGRELTEPKLSPDGSYVAFVAAMGGSSAIVVVAAAGGPERVLTTLPPPAAGRGFGGGCFDWLPDGSGVVYAAVGGDLWLHSIAGRAVTRLTRHGPDVRVEAPTVARDGSFAVYAVDQAEVWRCWIDRDLPAERLDDGTADFCFDPAITVDGTAAMWTAWNVPDMPWDAARVEHLTFGGSGTAIGTHGVRRYRRCASAANDAGRIEHHRARRHGLAQCLGRRPPVGRRTVRARRPVVGDGAAVIRRVTRRRSRRLHAQRARLRSDLRGGCPNRRR